MKYLIIVTLLSITNVSIFSWWTKSPVIKKYCEESVTRNGKFLLLHYPLISSNNDSIILANKKVNSELIKLNKANGKVLWQKTINIKPIAIAHQDEYIFVLTSSELYQYNSHNGEYLQKIAFYKSGNTSKYSSAQDLTVKDETLYISLGPGGVNTYFFDDKNIIYIENFSLNVNPDNNHRSYITGLSLSPDKKNLLLAIDNITLSYDSLAFEGFLIIDSEYLNIIETLPLKNNRESLGRPLVHWNFDNSFLVNNMNVLMGFSTKKKPRERQVSPNKRFLKYANGGRPLGRILVEENKISYCELVGKAHQKHLIPAVMTYEP